MSLRLHALVNVNTYYYPVTNARQCKYTTRGNRKSGRRSITNTIRQLLISFRSELRGDCANAVPTTTNYDVQSPQREMLG